MKVYDMNWMQDEKWFYFEGLMPVIRDDAPQEVKDSFQNYLKQLKEEHKE